MHEGSPGDGICRFAAATSVCIVLWAHSESTRVCKSPLYFIFVSSFKEETSLLVLFLQNSLTFVAISAIRRYNRRFIFL